MMMVKQNYYKIKSLSFLGLFFALQLGFSQQYKEVKPFLYPLSLNRVIVSTTDGLFAETFTKKYPKFKIVKPLNPLGYFEVEFQNQSNTFQIFSRAMSVLKSDKNIKDIYPIYKLNETLNSSVNFKRIGFSHPNIKESEELYSRLLELIRPLTQIFESKFRNAPKKFMDVFIQFTIKDKKTVGLTVRSDHLTSHIEKEIRHLFVNQKWNTTGNPIVVKLKPIIFKEVR